MKSKPFLALIMAILGMVFIPVPSHAQGGFLSGRSGGMRSPSHVPFRGGHTGGYLTGPRGRGSYHHRGNGYAYPYLYPGYYYSDYYSEPTPQEEPPTRVVVVENSQPKPETPPPPPPESLVLELHGNHWVRITDSGQTVVDSQGGQKGPAKGSSLRTVATQQNEAAEAPRELPPAVLVFRDGHKEEVTRYTIVGGTIYTNADYWNDGSWTKKVPIAELDVPATLELNRERGANFSLPSSPGVVAIRP
jgi:hypothetical protein